MDRLNYQHLYYFWVVAKYGSITRASERLRLSQPTISSQLSSFERAIGSRLFHKDGRRLSLTDVGRRLFRYSEQIFKLGEEITSSLREHESLSQTRLIVGAVASLPKLVIYHLVSPALDIGSPVQLVCFGDKRERLMSELALHSVDLVISDTPATTAAGSRVYNHLIGQSPISVFALKELAPRFREDFPESLDGAPLLLQTTNIELRTSLDEWFEDHKIRPEVKAEIEDSALLKTFAAEGVGLVIAPSILAKSLDRQYGLDSVGELKGVTEQFYAITTQRKSKNASVSAILRGRDTADPAAASDGEDYENKYSGSWFMKFLSLTWIWFNYPAALEASAVLYL